MWRRTALSLSPWISSSSSSSSSSFRSLINHHQTHSRLMFVELFVTEVMKLAEKGASSNQIIPFITFVLGGPGSGKGTQCAKIADTFGFAHLSAGDLLRKEMSSDSINGAMIRDAIKEGKIVPSKVTVSLLCEAIELSKNHKILIDGFPRSDENRISFERITGREPDMVIFFDCPEDEMVKRVLSRNQGRIDDNIETVKKRLKVFSKLNLPVVNYYSGRGKVHKDFGTTERFAALPRFMDRYCKLNLHPPICKCQAHCRAKCTFCKAFYIKINGVGTIEEVFEKVRPLFASLRSLQDSS